MVLDNYGNPLPGVSIFIKNSPGVGTVSDVDGKFMIKAAKRETVVFQMIGMTSYEYYVEESEEDVVITLGEDVQQLEEVVITGLTSQKKFL